MAYAPAMQQTWWKTKPALAALALGLCVLASVSFLLLRDSAEQQIVKAFTRSAQTVAVKSGDTPVSRLARINGVFSETMGDYVSVSVGELGIAVSGRRRAAEAGAHAGSVYQSAQVEILRTDVRIDESKKNARLTASVAVSGSVGGERRLDTREVNAVLRNDDGWRITSVEVLPAAP